MVTTDMCQQSGSDSAVSHLDKELYKRAEELASRPYTIEIGSDETTDGEPCFYVRVAELPGCVSHGMTIHEAKTSIESAR